VSISDQYDDRLLGELAALADGSLRGARRAELEAQVARDPELAAALAEQQRAVSLIRGAAAEVEAPLALRERLERDRVRVRAPARRRWVPSFALAGVAATLLAVVVALSGGPTVEDAAAFAAQPPAGPPPPQRGVLLAERVDGLAFPAWAAKFGWRASGTRRGEVDGRAATTVYYTKDGKTLAYTIVAGDALDGPGDARTVTVEGTPIDLFRADGRPAATWERRGHTCVLTGRGVPDAKLAELAGWRAKGDIPF
jgi:hypothetical protein